MKFIQCFGLVDRIFRFHIFSIVIKIAIDVKRAVLLINRIPTIGLSIDNADVVIPVLDPHEKFSSYSGDFFSSAFHNFSDIFHYQS